MELNWIKQQNMIWIIVILNVMLPKMINLNELMQNVLCVYTGQGHNMWADIDFPSNQWEYYN